ncbi:MAG: hypothetical protein U9Q04_03390, partial [Campylobacterota bacterium]|nr:hypothetical protein [Campylobacterota bacterium]
MFQEIIIEIIKRIENLTKEKRSIVELDIADIKNQIQELLFKIDFTPNTIEDIDFRKIKKLEVTPKEALGLLFLSFTTTLRSELSYGSLWLDIVEVLTEFEEEEDKNSFFADHYIEDSEPTDYLNEAIKDAVIRFNLRDGYDTSRPTDTVLLQMGILNIFKNINYWLTSNSKNSIIQELTNRSSQNFSTTFNSGWKVLQRHSQSLISKEDATTFLESNIWF